MGIDPVTHKPKSDALSSADDGQSKTAANLSHMAQWESARLEAEARLVRESKLRSTSFQQQLLPSASDSASASALLLNKTAASPASPLCLDVLKAWQGGWSKPTKSRVLSGMGTGAGIDLESPTSTLSFSENLLPVPTVGFGENPKSAVDFAGSSATSEGEFVKEEGEEDWKSFGRSATGLHDFVFAVEDPWSPESSKTENGRVPVSNFIDGFTDLLLNNCDDRNSSEGGGDSDNADGTGFREGPEGADYEENKNYWNNILNLVNSSSPDSPVF